MTPKYIFSKEKLIENYNYLKRELAPCTICYALKANAHIEVLKVLHETGASFESASVNEYKRLRSIGVDNAHIIFGLPIKSREIIKEIYGLGGRYFVFDDMRELVKLEQEAPLADKILRIYISDLNPRNIGYGMMMEEMNKNIRNNQLLERMNGVSFHFTENVNIENEFIILDRIEKILKKLVAIGKKGMILNIGGSYRLWASQEYFKQLRMRLHYLVDEYEVKLLAEPGLAIVNSAGSFRTKVIMTKEYGVFTDVYIDGGAPNGIKDAPKGVINLSNCDKCMKKIYRFIDITCLNRVLFTKRLSFSIEIDDILELLEIGAYSLVYRNDFHLWGETAVEII